LRRYVHHAAYVCYAASSRHFKSAPTLLLRGAMMFYYTFIRCFDAAALITIPSALLP